MESKPHKTREEVEVFLRSVPKNVHFAAVLASVVGVLTLVRFCANAWTGKMEMGKAFFYGLLIFGLLSLNGFSLIRKSRVGYMVVAIVAALPILGLLAQSLHLVVLLISGNWLTDKVGALICALSVVQLFITGVLFFFLLSRDVRVHVWKQMP